MLSCNNCRKHSNLQRLAPNVDLGAEEGLDPDEVDLVEMVVGDQNGTSDVGNSQNEGEC